MSFVPSNLPSRTIKQILQNEVLARLVRSTFGVIFSIIELATKTNNAIEEIDDKPFFGCKLTVH